MFKLGLYTLIHKISRILFFSSFFPSQKSARNGCESLCSTMVTLQGAELRAQGFFGDPSGKVPKIREDHLQCSVFET